MVSAARGSEGCQSEDCSDWRAIEWWKRVCPGKKRRKKIHTVVITSLTLPGGLPGGRSSAGEGISKGNIDCAESGDGGGRGDGGRAAGGEDVGCCAKNAVDELLEQTVGLRQPRRHGDKSQEDGTDAGHGETAWVDA